jgi:UPF0755 protein
MKQHWAVNGLTYILGLMFNAFLLLITGYLVYTYTMEGQKFGEDFANKLTHEGPDEVVEFVLEEDTPRDVAAAMLEEADLIPNKYYYQLELFLKDSSTIYKKGTYTLNKNMSTMDINVTLRALSNEEQAAAQVTHQITVPEGWGIREIAQYLEEQELMTAVEFIVAVETHDFNYAFLDSLPSDKREYRLEGYLFPDTYYLSANPTPDEVINKMLSRFDEIFDNDMDQRVTELGITMDQAVIMASMIEKEVRLAEERPLVSQVIYNRLDAGIALQIDATVLYTMKERPEKLLFTHLEQDTPYNTYLYPGLPVGPIANPGAESLRAALFPHEGDYLYYVLINEETGEHFFTDDYDEFLQAQG